MRDKQIEEMADIICKSNNPTMRTHCDKCVFSGMCDIQDGCEALYNAGYRKASDVAREIFEEIEKLISSECLVIKDEDGIRGYVDASVHYILVELKKKYESEGEG